jgi:uncharacterized RDD family membrane protein YckC
VTAWTIAAWFALAGFAPAALLSWQETGEGDPPSRQASAEADPVAFPQLPGAASGHHLWFATPDPERPRRSLIHHVATDRETPAVRVAAVLDGQVEAIAAYGDRVWIVLSPRAGTKPRREVVTLSTARNPASGLDYTWPREGPTLLPSLPGGTRLADFGADASGPIALLWPPEWRSSRVRRSPSEGEPPRCRLLRLSRAQEWEEIGGTPAGYVFERFAPQGNPARSLAMLAADPDSPDTAVVLVPVPGAGGIESVDAEPSSWRRWSVPIGRIVAATSLEHAALLTVRRAFGSLDLEYPREREPLELAKLDSPRGPWRVAATLDGIRFLEDADGSFRLRSIDPISGEIGRAAELGPPTFASGAWMHLPILGALAISAVLALILFRPIAEREPPAVPEGFGPLPWTKRLAALAVDLMPGIAISMMVLGVSLRDFSLMPAWSLDAEATAPSAFVIAITFLWGVAWEAIVGRTPGKILLGGRVISASGDRVGFGRVIVRNLFKAVLLAAPILAIFTLLNPLGQGIGEVLSRTLVLGRIAAPGSDRGPGQDDRDRE